MFIVDTHCDTLHGMLLKNEGFERNTLQIDFEKLQNSSTEGFLQFFAVFESPSNLMDNQIKDVRLMIDSYKKTTDRFNLKTVLKKEDLNGSGLKSLLSLEGLYFMQGDVDLLDGLYDDGVRCISLTWNPDNEFSGGVSGKKGAGLSESGIRLAKKAIKKGILLDVSHITDKGFWDIEKLTKDYGKPFVATHSNVRRLCSHKRNLNDNMLKALAKCNGVSGINMFSCFLNDDCVADINDVIKHIEYICALTGSAHVGFGCDFDGIDKEKSAVPGPESLNEVLEVLLKMNYTEQDVKNIAGGNFIRVLNEVLV